MHVGRSAGLKHEFRCLIEQSLAHTYELLQVIASIELMVAPILKAMDERKKTLDATCHAFPLFAFVIWSMEAATPARKVDEAART